MNEPHHVRLTLHPDGVVAPALRAIKNSVEVASFCLSAIESGNLSKLPELESSRFQFQFRDVKEPTEDERKVIYTNWLLEKGFQELARGIRAMLEEAYFYNCMVALAVGRQLPQTWDELQEQMREFHLIAMRLNFPDIMGKVNAALTEPLHFEKQFLSLQTVRNCLEHRAGVVTVKDVEPGQSILRLAMPQIKMYIEREGAEVDVYKGMFVEKGQKIMIKSIVKEREFKLGERITFNPEEFHDIGYGCWAFTQDLASKLPKLREMVSNQPVV